MIREVSIVSFDADGTLWAFEATMRASLAKTADFLGCRDERLAGLTVDHLIGLRQQVAGRHRGAPLTMEELRRRSFAEAVRTAGIDDDDLVDQTTAFYLDARFAGSILYDDARSTLDLLATRFALVLVSNGNSDPDRCGLADVFRSVVFADRIGVAKPDPGIYRRLLDEMGCEPSQVVHVGDSLVNDVDAAASLGLRTVWLRRSAVPLAHVPSRADATIHALSELPALLEGPVPAG